MLVQHTPRSSLDTQHPRGRSTGFSDLPLELKEQIYEYCLVDVSPAVYIVYKHAEASRWSFRDIPNTRVPAPLLVCKTMRQEVVEVLYRITDGPSVRINPDFSLHWWTFDNFLFDKADETQNVFDLAPILATVRKVKLELNMSSSFAEQGRILALLRWLVAVLNLGAVSGQPPDGVSVELTLERPDLWPKENDSVGRILKSLSCRKLSVACLLRDRRWYWEKRRIEELCGSGMGSESSTEKSYAKAEMASKALLDSCKREQPRTIPVEEEPLPLFRTARWWPSFRGDFLA